MARPLIQILKRKKKMKHKTLLNGNSKTMMKRSLIPNLILPRRILPQKNLPARNDPRERKAKELINDRTEKKGKEEPIEKRREKRPERKEKPFDPSKAKALRNIIHPSIEKVSKTVTDEKVLTALSELKSAFDVAEGIQPGTSHNFVAQIIDALKKSSQQQQQGH